MTTLNGDRPDSDRRRQLDLIDEKAWQHLGITGEEFRRRWWSGEFQDDQRPEVRALDRLMRTATWDG